MKYIVVCNTCGTDLTVISEDVDMDAVQLTVEPCAVCLDETASQASAEGYEEGFEDGKEGRP